MKTLVLTVNSRCQHGNPLAYGEIKCDACKWEDRVLNMRPPFKVKCIDAKNIDLEKDGFYTVVAIIISGQLAEEKTAFPCYLLKMNDGSISKGYYFGRFEPV